MDETIKEVYRFLSSVEFKDGQGQVQGNYRVGQEVKLEQKVGDQYVREGRAVNLSGEPVVEISTEEALGSMGFEEVTPTQTEENATIGIDTGNEVKHAIYSLKQDQEILETSYEAGSELELATEIGEALVAEGKAEKISE